ncbi:MAG TPA: efflux RND transporter permease subunit [Steroidobacter sp.]|uniref:efflux RND transporter permease subunit n=1 Tax=Steroidobacter sp. TaxID=1978227 RepID=UPI002EDA7787
MIEPTAHMGISGRIARAFLDNQLTPLLALTAMLMGVLAVLVTPREEEPQIDVTMANVIVPFPGASAVQVENLVSSPMEQVLGEIAGVKHVYSVSRPGVALLTVQFEVGEPRTEAIVRLYNAVYSNRDWRPRNLGVLEPLIKPKGIDDVPIVTLTLWTPDPSRGSAELRQVAHAIETELQRIKGTRDVYTVGGPDDVVHVQLDAQRLAGYGLSVHALAQALAAANVVTHAGDIVAANAATAVQVGEFLAQRDDVANLVVGLHGGHPVYLQDVAEVTRGPDQPEQMVWFGAGPAAAAAGIDLKGKAPAVTIAVTKQPGTNAIDIADRVLERVEALRDIYLPAGVEVTVTRNYGETANDKAVKLIQKLLFATISVIALVMVAVGRREAIVVGSAVIITLAATLFASWAWGFTINRVSLFALIFSIGILVDDAIVVVENIHRHLQLAPPPTDRGAVQDLIARAVDEVGGPTILATFTVIAALLPMAFVSGLMGPYMSPIPINASMGMVISLAVALIFTPWLSRRLLASGHSTGAPVAHPGDQRLQQFFQRMLGPFLLGEDARKHRHRLYLGTGLAILIAISLAGLKWVVMKMLPFDNKSEVQIVLNMPEGTALERTALTLDELAAEIATVPEVMHYQAYAGTASPINFNGLVRQYDLRSGPQFGDIQVILTDKHERDRASHEIARDMRNKLAAIGKRHGASVQVVEVPPGPPVQAPIVAEIYGPRYSDQRQLAERIRGLFDGTADIVDTDDTVETDARRYVVEIDRSRAALLGVDQQAIAQTLEAALGGYDATFIRAGHERYPIAVRIELPVAEKADLEQVLMLEAPAASGSLIPLSEVATVRETTWDGAIHHKDLLPVVYVTGDMAGDLDSPLYGMFDLVAQIGDGRAGQQIEQFFVRQPEDPFAPAVKWDGEWQITYETFRDMGLAYSVGLILIYLLVVAQFRSYAVPLVIMAPIPLTIIGVMPGHALLGAQFTATSMIGMIALAGIIVRNSILLVDFVNQELAAGRELADAVIRAGAVRAKPIALTALAAMIGAFFILDDPIFNGLAVSLIFGILVSTLLTLVVIPILYFSYMKRLLAVE